MLPDPAQIEEAARLLNAGELVAFPTETVYGLGADAANPAAVARIFAAKGRPRSHPVIVHVASGSIVMGAPAGFDSARLDAVRQALSVAFPVKISGDIQKDRWYKLVWNASINQPGSSTRFDQWHLASQNRLYRRRNPACFGRTVYS